MAELPVEHIDSSAEVQDVGEEPEKVLTGTEMEAKNNKFLFLLRHLQGKYDVICDMAVPARYDTPPFCTSVRAEMKFLLTNYPHVRWNVEEISFDTIKALQTLLNIFDIQRMRSGNYFTVRHAKEKSEKGKRKYIIALLCDSILEGADCIDMLATGNVDAEKLPLSDSSAKDITHFRLLYQYYCAARKE
jgi:hypothetical protein